MIRARTGDRAGSRSTWRSLAIIALALAGTGCKRSDRNKWGRAWARTDNPTRDVSPDTRRIMAATALTPSARVADVGTGAGYFAFRFAAAVGPTGHVYATDVDPDMVDLVRREISRRRTPNVTAIRVASDELGLGPASVDAIAMINSVPMIDCAEDRVRAYLAQCHRALRAGGRVVIFRDYVHARGWRGPYGRPLECGDLPAARIVSLVADTFEQRSLEVLRPAGQSAGESPGYLLVLGRRP